MMSQLYLKKYNFRQRLIFDSLTMLFFIKIGDCKQKFNKTQNLEFIKIFAYIGDILENKNSD